VITAVKTKVIIPMYGKDENNIIKDLKMVWDICSVNIISDVYHSDAVPWNDFRPDKNIRE
jgi:hypothetical protein